jgi:uncharacterized membrane protein
MTTKTEYLDTLKRALTGLPPEVVADTMADYAQRFQSASADGRDEADTVEGLEDPKKIAAELRTAIRRNAFQLEKNLANGWRLFISLIGLAIFNLFMVVPAMVYTAMLFSFYAIAFSCYLGGIVFTAGSLSGVDEILLSAPFKHVIVHASGSDAEAADDDQVSVEVGPQGIHVQTGAASTEKSANNPRSISQDVIGDSRITHVLQGIAATLGGIALLLMCLVVSKYTFIGIHRYLQMNLALLKNA